MANESAQKRKKPVGKPRGKPFAPGNSANPGGRPKLPEDVKHVRELARQFTIEAIESLAVVMNTGSGPARVAAIKELLDRGWGKSAQPVTGADGEGPVDLSLKVRFE